MDDSFFIRIVDASYAFQCGVSHTVYASESLNSLIRFSSIVAWLDSSSLDAALSSAVAALVCTTLEI